MARLNNPINTLFGKLMLAFVTTALLVVMAMFGLAVNKQQWQSQPATPPMQELIERVGRFINANPSIDPKQAARRLRRFKEHNVNGAEPPPGVPRLEIHLIDPQGNVISSKRHRPRSLKQFLVDFEPNQPLRQQQFERQLYVGAKLLNNGNYLIIQLNRPPRPWLAELNQRPWLPLLLITIIATLVFGILAWRLRKPLRQLQQASSAIAAGQLDARVDATTSQRGDEIGQLGRGFNHMADSVSSMVKSQQRLLSDISHELRTPLTRLQLSLAIAERKGQQSAELERIRTDAEQLEAMLQELLNLSRLNQPDQYQKQQIDLISTIQPVLDGVAFEAEQQQIRLSTKLPSSASIFGNEILLQRMLENPLRNALRHTNSVVCIAIEATSKQLKICIEDDGAGVPELQLEQLFKPFHRVDEARNRDHGGWGLGLAITQAAVEAHQGRVWAENRNDGGLRIVIALPR